MSGFIVFIAIFILIFIGMAYAGKKAQERRDALAAWAQANGWAFDPGRDFSMDEQFPSFGCMRTGSNRYGFNRVLGSDAERGFMSFDYHYQTESKDSKGNRTTHTHYFSAVIMRSAFPLKPLSIRPEGFFDKITEFFGMDDIDFESAEFSRKFYVKSQDKRWAYDVIHTRMMEFLLANPQWTIEMDPFHVMITCGTGDWEVTHFQEALAMLRSFFDLFPDYLVRQQSDATQTIQ